MRDDVKVYVLQDCMSGREPSLVIRVRSLDGMKEEVHITDMEMMRCIDAEEEVKLLRSKVQELSEMTILPYKDLLNAVARMENGEIFRRYVLSLRPSPPPQRAPEPKPPEPEPEKEGWDGFMDGLAKGILRATMFGEKQSSIPKMRVVKGGKE